MTELHFLKQLLIVLTTTISIAFVFQKLRLPTIVGFVLAGLIIGPKGAGLIKGFGHVEILAEIGVALLRFSIGIEFSLAAILSVRQRVIWRGRCPLCFRTASSRSLPFIYTRVGDMKTV